MTFHLLQLGKAADELLRSFGVNARTPHLESAARVIAGLDLMISVDSMPTHLAGALGVSTWTLLPEPADWRWMSRPESEDRSNKHIDLVPDFIPSVMQVTNEPAIPQSNNQ